MTIKEFNRWRRELCAREIAEAQAVAAADKVEWEQRFKTVEVECQTAWVRELERVAQAVPSGNTSGTAQCARGLPAPAPSPTGLGPAAEGPDRGAPWRRSIQRAIAIIRGAFRGS